MSDGRRAAAGWHGLPMLIIGTAIAWLGLSACADRGAGSPYRSTFDSSESIARGCASKERVDDTTLFELLHTGRGDAEFELVRCDTLQSRPYKVVDRSDIRLAVVRQMIDVIRQTRTGDFEWESDGCRFVLSARPADQSQLEAFLLGNFYPRDPRGIAMEMLTKDCRGGKPGDAVR